MIDGPNQFGYVLANPIKFTDPTGRLAGLPLIPLLLTDLAFSLSLDVGLLLSFGMPGVVFVAGAVLAVVAVVAILVSLVMLIDAYRADVVLRNADLAAARPVPNKCEVASAVQMVPTSMLQYTDPRVMGDEEFDEFTADVAQKGILVPIKAVMHDGQYWIVDGNHRARAARRNGMAEVPVEVVTLPYGAFKTADDLEDYVMGRHPGGW
jgi:uncharacterized ParB-like nuclease family protein